MMAKKEEGFKLIFLKLNIFLAHPLRFWVLMVLELIEAFQASVFVFQ